MKERGILFSGEMVRAILDGRKTQTRRIVKPQPAMSPNDLDDGMDFVENGKVRRPAVWGSHEVPCRYGVVGDRLWVKETFQRRERMTGRRREMWTNYRADAENVMPWTPSIFMPRVLSRITLEITEVRVQRLQDISEDDARAEGVEACPFDREHRDAKAWGGCPCHALAAPRPFACSYFSLWHDINGGAEENPWVWAITFKRLDKTEGKSQP